MATKALSPLLLPWTSHTRSCLVGSKQSLKWKPDADTHAHSWQSGPCLQWLPHVWWSTEKMFLINANAELPFHIYRCTCARSNISGTKSVEPHTALTGSLCLHTHTLIKTAHKGKGRKRSRAWNLPVWKMSLLIFQNKSRSVCSNCWWEATY